MLPKQKRTKGWHIYTCFTSNQLIILIISGLPTLLVFRFYIFIRTFYELLFIINYCYGLITLWLVYIKDTLANWKWIAIISIIEKWNLYFICKMRIIEIEIEPNLRRLININSIWDIRYWNKKNLNIIMDHAVWESLIYQQHSSQTISVYSIQQIVIFFMKSQPFIFQKQSCKSTSYENKKFLMQVLPYQDICLLILGLNLTFSFFM